MNIEKIYFIKKKDILKYLDHKIYAKITNIYLFKNSKIIRILSFILHMYQCFVKIQFPYVYFESILYYLISFFLKLK